MKLKQTNLRNQREKESTSVSFFFRSHKKTFWNACAAGAKDVALVRSFPVTLGPDGILTIVFLATTDQVRLLKLLHKTVRFPTANVPMTLLVTRVRHLALQLNL